LQNGIHDLSELIVQLTFMLLYTARGVMHVILHDFGGHLAMGLVTHFILTY